MEISSVTAALPVTALPSSASRGGAGVHVLKEALAMQEELVSQLLAVGVENQVAAQKMAIAGRIVDAYA